MSIIKNIFNKSKYLYSFISIEEYVQKMKNRVSFEWRTGIGTE